MFESQEELKRSIIAMLLKLQASDAHADMLEFAYIHRVAEHLGLSRSDVLSVEAALDNYPLSIPSDEKDRMTILYYLLFLIEIDGEASDQEVILVEHFGLLLGFRIEMTRELIAVVKHNTGRPIPPEKMLRHIKKFLN